MLHEFTDNCTVTHCRSTNFSLGNDSLANVHEAEASVAGKLKVTFQVLIALFGVVGNIMVIIVISRLGKKKQPGDLYLQQLATADLGILLVAFPMVTIKDQLSTSWPLGEFVCCYVYPVPEIFHGASVWFIAVIAIERYRRVVLMKPVVRYKHKTLLQKAKTVAVCVWVASFLIFCFPLYFIVEYRELPNSGRWCGPSWPSWDRELLTARSYLVLMTLFSYILPLIIISCTYVAINRKINECNVFIKAMKQEGQDMNDSEDIHQSTSLNTFNSIRLNHNKRAKKILTPLVLVFAVSMLPLSVFRLTIAFWLALSKQEFYTNLLYIVSVCVLLNSSLNPVIYSLVSREFRKGMNDLWLQLRQTANSCNSVVMLRLRSHSSPQESSHD